MTQINLQIHESWKKALIKEFSKPYFADLKIFLQKENLEHKVYPLGDKVFEAFNTTPLDKVKVVIIGQDPYHGPNQAHGLCFSVNKGVPIPPSLRNIYKELAKDVEFSIPNHGYLLNWAKQGVFLLNATLTVRANTAGSHQKRGWETFTDAVIKSISNNNSGVIFLLWGGFAKGKQNLIDKNKHYILSSVHPSPLSANRGGWFGNKHFSQTNKILADNNKLRIDWQV